MAEDRILIDVVDTPIDVAIAKLQMAVSLSQQSFGTRNITQGAEAVQRQTQQLQFRLIPVTDEMAVLRYRLAQLGMKDLPSLNREMRVILGTIPGMRQAMQGYFGFKREYTAIGATIETGVVGPGLILATLTTIILLLRTFENQMKRIRQKQQEQDRWIKRTTGMYREEYDRKRKLWEHYARSKPG